MYGAIRFFSIGGITVRVHWTFLLVIGWIILLNVQSGIQADQLLWSTLFILALFACIILHESGHAWAASWFGIKAKNILLLPIGGVAGIEKFPDKPIQELLISASGPIVNLLIAMLLWLVFLKDGSIWVMLPYGSISEGSYFFQNMYLVNIGIAFFNLIPAFPLDGGRIFRSLLAMRMNYVKATTIAAATGKIFAVFFIGAGIVLVNFALPLIGFFIMFSANTEEFYLRIKALLKDIRVKDIAIHHYHAFKADMRVKEAAEILKNNYSRYFILTDELSKPIGTVSRMNIIKALAEKKYNKTLEQLASKEVQILDCNTAVEHILGQLARNQDHLYPVTEDGHYTGAIDLNQVIEFLLLHQSDSPQFAKIRSLAGLIH